MADIEAAGKQFLDALAKYIQWRIRESGPAPVAYVDRYGDYLEALGVESGGRLYNSLKEHMKTMKDAGRVPTVPFESDPTG